MSAATVSDERALVESTVTDALGALTAADADLAWTRLVKLGMAGVGLPEHLDGAGGDVGDAAVVLRSASQSRARTPLATSSWLAGWLVTGAGRRLPAAPQTAILAGPELTVRPDGGGVVLDGAIHRVPWLGAVERLLVVLPSGSAAVLDPDTLPIAEGFTSAGEPLGTVRLDGIVVPARDVLVGDAVTVERFRARQLAAGVVEMLGAADSIRAVTVTHVTTRIQFGRTLSRFQAVQHRAAELLAEHAVLEAAAEIAVEQLAKGTSDRSPHLLAAVVSAHRAAGVIAEHAHQLHGAMGFTVEHPLHRWTGLLWARTQEGGGTRAPLGELRSLLDTEPTWDLLTADTDTTSTDQGDAYS